jgi:hypothetical protein
MRGVILHSRMYLLIFLKWAQDIYKMSEYGRCSITGYAICETATCRIWATSAIHCGHATFTGRKFHNTQ